jgi:hypothetical protein
MAKGSGTDVLKRGQKVVALTDFRGVPRGTVGRIEMVSGIAWTRYFVDFATGVSVATVDRSKIATPDEWKTKKDQPYGVAEAEATDGAAAAGGAGGAAAGESVGGIPAHLLERSRLARERLAAKAG